MEVAIPCGHDEVHLVLPTGSEILEPLPMPVLKDPEGAVSAALSHPIESLALAELTRGRKNACVVISDITRPVPNRVILPPLLKTLESAGIERTGITILIATGVPTGSRHAPGLLRCGINGVVREDQKKHRRGKKQRHPSQ